MQISRKKILKLAAATLVFMSFLGYVIIELFHKSSLFEQLMGSFPWYYQIVLGSIYGLLTALLGWQLVKLPPLKETHIFFTDLIGSIKLSSFQIIFISFCAGVGEEILFRGAIQPFAGIWITSVLFVFLHGYLNPKNLPLMFYGIFMVLIISGIGYLAIVNGLLTAIVAHFMIDWVLITKLRNSYENRVKG